MRQLFKRITVNLISLVLISYLIGGIDYQKNIGVLLIASICLMLLNLIVRPILNLLFMPINLITLGASRWLINLIILYSVTIFVNSFKIIPVSISNINIPGLIYQGFNLSFFWSLVLISFLVEIIVSLLNWLLK